MFYFSGTDVEVAGASPGDTGKTGRRRTSYLPPGRNKTQRKDARRKTKALETELLADEKELAEHNMLVDLGRNDLGKISQIGSVVVEEVTCPFERYSHVMHIGSTVRGAIRRGAGRSGCCGCHPPGRNPIRCAEDPGLPDHQGTGRQ